MRYPKAADEGICYNGQMNITISNILYIRFYSLHQTQKRRQHYLTSCSKKSDIRLVYLKICQPLKSICYVENLPFLKKPFYNRSQTWYYQLFSSSFFSPTIKNLPHIHHQIEQTRNLSKNVVQCYLTIHIFLQHHNLEYSKIMNNRKTLSQLYSRLIFGLFQYQSQNDN